jgi:acyl-lipid omega-6 desaturase (Delta-12 desaturase)
MATNAVIGLIVAALIVLTGVKAFIVVCLPALLLAASMGVWLFYVQTQFEKMTWRDDESWSLHDVALQSHHDLPTVLRWITANIGIHYLHHLCSPIPYYRLPQVLRDCSELGPIGRLTLRESLWCLRLALWWDASQHRLISFHDALRLRRYSTMQRCQAIA